MTDSSFQADPCLYLGIDFGTSGCRAIVINEQKQILAKASYPLPTGIDNQQQAVLWIDGLTALLSQLSTHIELKQIQRLALDGTSGTVLLVTPMGAVLTAPLMYNDSSSIDQLALIQQHCPDPLHIVNSASSGLAKALKLSHPLAVNTAFRVLNQADYLSNYLTDSWGISDYHNALKMGYDLQRLEWPAWIYNLLPKSALPRVLEPGTVFATIRPDLAERFGFSKELQVCAGTTDANAAFISTESTQPGDAVTSLGSTIVLKILSQKAIQDLPSGIYSHKLGSYWLSGGASNAGGCVLKQFFTDQQLQQYSQQINPNQSSGLNYYPLPGIGERFPDMNPGKKPVLSPRPASDIKFLQGILEGLSRIEQQGYLKLQQLGTNPVIRVQTLGGGAANPQWEQIRSQMLGLPVSAAKHSEAAYGSALLALQGLAPYR